MNTCIKTGAKVFFLTSNYTIQADVHAIGNCVVIRTAAEPFAQGQDASATHVCKDYGQGYFREDLGFYVVPNHYLSDIDQVLAKPAVVLPEAI
jgi:hypothetical protein